MLITTQTWLIYPDDAKQLREDLQKHGIAVNFHKDKKTWHLGKFKQNFGIDSKPLFLDKGPFAGVRVEKVCCHDVLQMDPILKKCGWFVTQISQTDDEITFFVGKKSKKSTYEARLKR